MTQRLMAFATNPEFDSNNLYRRRKGLTPIKLSQLHTHAMIQGVCAHIYIHYSCSCTLNLKIMVTTQNQMSWDMCAASAHGR